jgi:hypothetical protein
VYVRCWRFGRAAFIIFSLCGNTRTGQHRLDARVAVRILRAEPATAETRIAEAIATRATALDLSLLGLDEWPADLFECTWLKELNVRCTNDVCVCAYTVDCFITG